MKARTTLACYLVLAIVVAEEPQATYVRQRKAQEGGSLNRPRPQTVGDKFTTKIDRSESSAILPGATEDGSRLKYDITFRPGASYTTVHFKDFDLSEGCTMVVSGKDLPDGTPQRYTMSGRGKMGLGTFWSQHVKGDTFSIEVGCDGNDPVEENTHFEIDEVAVGFVEGDQKVNEDPFGEAVCGTPDNRHVVCYPGSTQYNKARAVARLLVQGSSLCTGWLVSPNGYLITNEHCISNSGEARNTDYEFGAEAPNCGDNNCQLCHSGSMTISGATFIKDSGSLDYALVQFQAGSGSPQNTFGYLEIDDREAVLNETIYIPQHPSGRAKEFGIESSHAQNPGGLCRIDRIEETGCTGSPHDYGYFCDTQGGSSGSPVLASSSNKVIALHHCRGDSACTQAGNDPNRGVPIKLINAEISSIIGTSAPTNPPVATSEPSSSPTVAPVPTVPTPPPTPFPPTPPPTPSPTPAPTPRPTVSCSPTQKEFSLELTTDKFGSEISWYLKNTCSGATALRSQPYVDTDGDAEYMEQYCVGYGQQYVFVIEDSYGDGVCCLYGNGCYKIYYDGVLEGSGSNFTTKEAHTFGACTITPAPTPVPTPFPTTKAPTPAPTDAPSAAPSAAPTFVATEAGFGLECFSGAALVDVEDQGLLRMSEVSIGDKVLTSQGYQRVYAFAHNDTQSSTAYLQILTAMNPETPLEVTEGHLVFLAGKPHAVPANSIKPGDVLQTSQGQDGAVVLKITTIYRDGIYAPLTTDGTVVVDGIVSSCYLALQAHAGETVVLQGGINIGLSQHFVAHIAMSPVRMVCMGVSPTLCQLYDKNGLAYFAKAGFGFLHFADNQSLPVQVVLLALYLLVFASLYIMECMLGAKLAAMVVLGLTIGLVPTFLIRRIRDKN